MVYVTGDTHGELERFKGKHASRLKKGDTLLICGDFGFVWDGSKEEERTLAWLSRRKYNILFVEGAHENFSLLNEYEQVDFCGGRARQISKNIFLLRRGDIFTIENKKWFAFGGGDDEEIDFEDVRDCEEFTSLPGDEDIARARGNLESAGNKVDYIITHDINFKVKSFLQMEQNNFNNLHAFLDEVARTCDFGRWYFGCYHLDKIIPPCYYCVYKEVLDAATGTEAGK